MYRHKFSSFCLRCAGSLKSRLSAPYDDFVNNPDVSVGIIYSS